MPKYKVQKLRLPPALPNRDFARQVRHAAIGRVWETVAVCDKRPTAESVARNVRIDSDELVRIVETPDRPKQGGRS
jgi:hypothetical protein